MVGIIGYNVGRWITVVAIARLGGATLLGEFALANAIVVPIFLFANLQLPGLLATDASRTFSRQAYFAVNTAGSTVAVLLAVLFRFHEGTLAVALFAIARSIDSWSELIGGSLQRSGRFRPIAIGQLLNGLLTALATLGVLRFEPTTPGLAVASVLGSVFALIFINHHSGPAEWRGSVTRPYASQEFLSETSALLKLGLPMGCAAGLIGLSGAVPTLFLGWWVDKVDLGVFSAVSLPVVGIGMVVASSSQVAAPRLATLFSIGDYRNVKRHIAWMLAFGSCVGLLASLFCLAAGGWFLSALYGDQYRPVAHLLVILCFGAAIRAGYLYVGVVLTVIRKPHVQLYVRVIALLVLALALRILIPTHGIAGAAWGIFVATIVEACAWAAILAFYWRAFDRAGSTE